MNANPNKSTTQHQPIFIGNTKTDISNKKLPANIPKRNLVGNELNFSNPGANCRIKNSPIKGAAKIIESKASEILNSNGAPTLV
jgi:hypothetical protein